MERKRTALFFLMLLFCLAGFTQQDKTIVLDEVILSDAKLLHFSNGIKVQVLTDSVLQRNGTSLTDALRYTTPIYFRENGFGMVSSASFRGTNASHTAVVWNGINVNSQLTGQTDFNTVMPQSFDEVVVRSGGGSVQYGSGAIGGTILLNDSFEFNEHFTNRLRLGYGSFDTSNLTYDTSFGNEKTVLNFGAHYSSSANDYKHLGTDDVNENGAFENLSLNANFGYRLSEHQLLKFFHNTFLGDRDFSGTLTAPSNDNYKNLDARSLVEWDSFKGSKVARLKLAHLYEKYRYFANKENDDFSFGRSNTFILNYDYTYKFKKVSLNGIVDANIIDADGTSIEKAKRNTFSGIFLLSHSLNDKFKYGINLRKDIVSDYESPLLISVDSKYQITEKYALNLNGSKNYRIPTFNDLYWIGAGATGNLGLMPETSIQLELGQRYEAENYKINLTAYYILSNELIQWRPDVSGIWSPVNIADVTQYGVELATSVDYNWGDNSILWQNQYAFTKSVNNETKYQLLYVPKHKVTSNIAYSHKKWGLQYQLLYNGSVFTTTDNSDGLERYIVNNLALDYNLKITSNIDTRIGFSVRNLLNETYQNVAFRPMPNRNYQLQLITKF